jgi:PAS domain S-box-containing protein
MLEGRRGSAVPVCSSPVHEALVALDDPEAFDLAVTITDASGTILAVNTAFTDLHGFPASAVLGRGPAMLASGLQPAGFYADLWSTITSGQVWEGELVDRTATGDLRSIHTRICPVRDPRGRLHRFVGFQHEVATPVDEPAVGHLRITTDGRCTAADARSAELLEAGTDPDALLGTGVLAALDELDALELVESLQLVRDRDVRTHVDVEVGSRYLRLRLTPDSGQRRPVVAVTIAPLPTHRLLGVG